MPYSYATERKIRIIEDKLGPNWKEQRVGQSIDAIYNDLVGDTRKNLFCKINASVKDRLDEIRGLEDMAPVEGGDVRYRPLNMGELGTTDSTPTGVTE